MLSTRRHNSGSITLVGRVLLLGVLTICQTANVLADGPGGPQNVPDVTTMSLEDLMNLQVTSVSKRTQKVADAAAAIFVITQDDIRRIRSDQHSGRPAHCSWPGSCADRREQVGHRFPWIQREIRRQIAGSDRWPQRLHPSLFGCVLERAGRNAGGRGPHRSHPRPGRDAVGRERRRWRDQHHHQVR